MPGFVVPRTVSVQGEVLRPGPYGLEFREERLSTILERSGGATGEAYVPGAQLLRDSVPVGIDLQAALANPGSRQDVILEDGDVLILPPLDPTVLVEGAVAFVSRVVYRDGEGLEDYLRRSGGTLADADLDRVSITYPSGERATVRKTLGFRRYPDVQPGSTIFVPREAEDAGIDWGQVLNQTLTATTTIITLLLAFERLSGG
jgi:protein involved in polysaccharide export with SLBB domain